MNCVAKRYVIFLVTDIKIFESALKNIFQPFRRGENGDLIQGTGLSLSIVKKAIEAMGGKIRVNSTIRNGTSLTPKYK
ncbi:sensor histidine kinase [Maribacter sp. ACAM166]|uniref:sensor histidine kinase n=1 Tax=Maribacter sp. ACAM166 TaxID=2508996 RepID=UPI001484FDC7|nr:ATP-binding protein [Maribacter sp. ACAM166]